MAKFAIEMDEVQQISENNVLYLYTFYSFSGQWNPEIICIYLKKEVYTYLLHGAESFLRS